VRIAIVFAVVTTWSTQATAAGSGPDTVARALAASCTGCHGTGGNGEGGLPALAGRDAAALRAMLAEYKAGTRAATVMHQHAKGYSDAQLDAIAGWYAAQPAPPTGRAPE
jgi:cytochrome c553